MAAAERLGRCYPNLNCQVAADHREEEGFVMWDLIKRWINDENGATMIEYAFMLVLIAFVCVGIVTAIGLTTNGKFDTCAQIMP